MTYTDRKLNNGCTCSNILKIITLCYKRKIIVFLNKFLNLKSRHIIEGVTAQIEKKQDKRACESISLEKLNIKIKIKTNEKN